MFWKSKGECVEKGRGREKLCTLSVDIISTLSGLFSSLARSDIPACPKAWGVLACTVNAGIFSSIPCG